MVKDSLGNRMKSYYEEIPKIRLMRRTPVALRIDGKAFHTFTKGFKKPFDELLIKSMQDTMKYLCENIQGCVFGYTQSDEITLILVDYQTLDTCAWFDNEVQKMCSVAASMATLEFNRSFCRHIDDYMENTDLSSDVEDKYTDSLIRSLDKGAMFDCRCFNIPKEEVCNLIFWRQQDATRNSIEMVGRAYFSHKELHKKNTSMIQDMLHEKFNVNWNDFPVEQKRGSACLKDDNGKWYIDHEMPILKGNDRQYVDQLIYVGD